MKIKFCGANQEVTGSNYLVEFDSGMKILVDCGLFQGSKEAEEKNYAPFVYNPSEIDALIVTHAHLDHTGRIPKLLTEGFKGKIYGTEATRDLTKVVLEDAGELMAEEAQREDHPPLYQPEDVNAIFPLWQQVSYNHPIKITEDIQIEFLDAGHILGSASIKIHADGQTLAFSGDVGNPPVPLLNPPEYLDGCDSLVIESTYGGRLHEPSGEREKLLRQAIIDTIKSGGTLMVPAFAIERTQELLYELNELFDQHLLPAVPVFLDSPMAIDATKVFRHYNHLFNSEDKHKSKFDDLFNFPGLTLTATVEESKKINDITGPKVIIAGAGMMNGGRILHHAVRYLPDYKSRILFVGYQVEGSVGRQLLDKAEIVKIHGQQIQVRAKVQAIGAYSAHADQAGLIKFITEMRYKPKRIFITHGEIEQATALSAKIKSKLDLESKIPVFGEEIDISSRG